MANAAAKRENLTAENKNELVEAKRARTDDENEGKDEIVPDTENILSGFKTSSVLNDSAREKIAFIHGKVVFLKVSHLMSLIKHSNGKIILK